MTPEFKPGDAVGLISGGPVMTVDAVLPRTVFRPHGMVRVIWFSNSEIRKGQFLPDTLKKT